MGHGRVISLEDVALALALPCSRRELDELSLRGSDFVARLQRQFPRSDNAARWAYYDMAFASLATDVTSRLTAMGVTVVRRATGSALKALLREKRLVGLVAHHPLQPLGPQDIVDRERLVHALILAPARPTVALRETMGTDPSWQSMNGHDLAACLHAACEASDPYYGVMSEERRRTTLSAPFSYSRLWIERRFDGAIRPGPCLELWDQSLDLERLAALFPAEYEGAMDLVICNSVLHAQVLKARFPAATFAANTALARASARLVRFASMIAALKQLGRIDVRDLLQAAMRAGTGV